jgi:ParB-like nuclease domain
MLVAVTLLHEDANNPRTEVPEAALEELAADIQQRGILQPLVVHPADGDGRHLIHFGAKRLRAAIRAGLSEVPIVVRDLPVDRYAQVAENQKRRPALLSGQSHRARAHAQAERGWNPGTCPCHTPARSRHRGSPCAAGDGQGDWRRARHGCHRRAPALHQQGRQAADRRRPSFEREGKEALRDLVEQWRLGGSRIPEISERREAFNIMLSMQRLNPRKEDLRRWRETFAERLRGWGIEAEAPSQVTRGTRHRNERVWEGKTGLPREARPERAQALPTGIRKQALQAWAEIMRALAASPEEADRKLAQSIGHYVARVPAVQAIVRHHAQQRKLTGMSRSPVMTPSVQRRGPEIER